MIETTHVPMIAARMVADLRNQSDTPMMQCTQAPIAAEGDMGLAFEFIRNGIPPKSRQTLFEALTGWRAYQMNKHDLGETHVEDSINQLTQYEFLREISDYLANPEL
jgi:translation elongation factor EF-Ts